MSERSIEYRFVFETLTEEWPRTVLDIGTGLTALPSLIRTCGFLVTAIDNIQDYWSKQIFNIHYYIINDDIIKSKLNLTFDFIISISVLEHIKDYEAAILNMFNLLNKEGHLVLTFPYNEKKFIDNAYKLPGSIYKDSPFTCQVFSRNEINKWLNTNNGIIKKQEYWKVFTGDYWAQGDYDYPPRKVNKEEKHHLSCILIKKK